MKDDDLLRHAHRTIGDSFAKLSPEEAQALAAQYQEQVMKQLFGFLTLTGNSPTTSASPTTNTNNEKETDSRLN